MNLIKKNIPLLAYNTFGISAFAEQWVEINNVETLYTVLLENELPIFILGGGSNLLLTENIRGLVIHNNIKGIEMVQENPDFVWIKAGAGEVWHDLVLWCVEHGFGGIENLSLIPGRVGAAPVQNIGAYGVELKDVFEKLEAVPLNPKKWAKRIKKSFLIKRCVSLGIEIAFLNKQEKASIASSM